ncbi:MAG: SDR family oxidoreductase [Acidobacteria bacterium]|nr:SDR family oxidoreductase [Acidobacteriota bacterium]
MPKVAIVTGGARGIGGACVDRLRLDGFVVASLDLLPPDQAEAHSDLYFPCDITDASGVEEGFATVHARWGRLDLLVNNAAQGIRAHLVDQTEADVRRSLEVCLMGTWRCTQLAARRMIRQGEGGSIVSITSVMSEYTAPGSSTYSGAKAALNAMTRTWASELAPHRIRVNAIEPGWIDTPGERIAFGNRRVNSGGKALPLGRIGQPKDIAAAVAYLASRDASYVTGTILRVDGGFTLIR